MRVFSFGGGVQSTAVLVLIAQKRLQYEVLLFANVGEDSESPLALQYIREIAWPYAERNGIRLEEVKRVKRDGTVETILGRIKDHPRSIPLPVFLPSGAPGNRTCTRDFKVLNIARWLRKNGATKDNPTVVGLGISTDEFQRARTDSGFAYETLEYPLLDLRMSRADCIRLIKEAGLPVPPKSACWFCPFTRPSGWKKMARTQPALFQQAVDLDQHLRDRRETLGLYPVFLSGRLIPLDELVADGQAQMFDDETLDTCESGYCFT